MGRVGAGQSAIYFPEISPDGKSIAVSARDGEVNDREVWVHDVAGGSKRVHSPAKGNDNFPIWSPDSKQIIWTSSRTGEYELYRRDSLLLKQPASQYPRSISPDGKWLLYTHADKKRDLYLLNLDGELKPKPVFSSARYWSEGGAFHRTAGTSHLFRTRRARSRFMSPVSTIRQNLGRSRANSQTDGDEEAAARDGAPMEKSSST